MRKPSNYGITFGLARTGKKPQDLGILVTFEGTEGAGKSTLIQKLAASLREHHFDVVLTREPGGTAVSETLRNLLLSQAMHARTELLLYEAARAEHVEQVIRPALLRGQVVLCDRYTDSSLAYQAHARGLNWKQVVQLNTFATDGITPKLTVWVDVDPAVGLARATDANRFEAEGVLFQKKVRAGFARARKQNSKRWVVVRSDRLTPDQMHAATMRHLLRVVQPRGSSPLRAQVKRRKPEKKRS